MAITRQQSEDMNHAWAHGMSQVGQEAVDFVLVRFIRDLGHYGQSERRGVASVMKKLI